MDNEGLLEWAEYDVKSAWEVLKRAEANRDKLRKIVKGEKCKKVDDIVKLTQKLCEFIDQETARIQRENEFTMEYGRSDEEYEQAEKRVEEQKAFWARY